MRVTDLRTMFTIDLQKEYDKQRRDMPDGVACLGCFIGVNQAGTLFINPDLTVATDDPDVWRAVVQDGKVIGIIYPNEPEDQPWNSTILTEWVGLPGTEGLAC